MIFQRIIDNKHTNLDTLYDWVVYLSERGIVVRVVLTKSHYKKLNKEFKKFAGRKNKLVSINGKPLNNSGKISYIEIDIGKPIEISREDQDGNNWNKINKALQNK